MFKKSKELKFFIEDLKRISEGKPPFFKHYVFYGPRATGKTLLAHRIEKLLPNSIVVIDEPIDERLNLTPCCAITIYTTVVPFSRGAFNLRVKRKAFECPIEKDKTEDIKDIIKQAKKLFN